MPCHTGQVGKTVQKYNYCQFKKWMGSFCFLWSIQN